VNSSLFTSEQIRNKCQHTASFFEEVLLWKISADLNKVPDVSIYIVTQVPQLIMGGKQCVTRISLQATLAIVLF
jgi:hypothetical protein